MNKTDATVNRAMNAINDRIIAQGGRNVVTERDIYVAFDPGRYLARHHFNVREAAHHLADDFMKYHRDDIPRW